jgi:hypothetical protein
MQNKAITMPRVLVWFSHHVKCVCCCSKSARAAAAKSSHEKQSGFDLPVLQMIASAIARSWMISLAETSTRTALQSLPERMNPLSKSGHSARRSNQKNSG